MNICRVLTTDGIVYAEKKGNIYHLIEGDIYGEFTVTAKVAEAQKLLSPVQPTKVVALGVNYAKHREEMKHDLNMPPVIFMKPLSSILEPNGNIIYPSCASLVHYEAELVIVIKKKCHKVKSSDAREYILGYTVANDVSERNFQKQDGQWIRAKGYDTFCPIGESIAVGVDADSREVTTTVNGVERQRGNTRDLIFNIDQIIQVVSEIMTLEQGDVILTGTPQGVGEIKAGDVVKVEVEGVSSTVNKVIAEQI